MRKNILTLFMTAMALLLSGCGANTMAHDEAGEKVVDLPPGKKLVFVSADKYNDYYTCRDMREGELPEEYVQYIKQDPGSRLIIREHAKR